jgi:hypothetical protein
LNPDTQIHGELIAAKKLRAVIVYCIQKKTFSLTFSVPQSSLRINEPRMSFGDSKIMGHDSKDFFNPTSADRSH